jgi:DNA replication protein DnaC
MDVRFKTPANFYISGQSQTGKSYLVRQLLYNLNDLFDPVPSKIVYCFAEHQEVFHDMAQEIPNISFVKRFPDNVYDILEGYKNSLVIIDDLMSECSKDQRVSDLFTVLTSSSKVQTKSSQDYYRTRASKCSHKHL